MSSIFGCAGYGATSARNIGSSTGTSGTNETDRLNNRKKVLKDIADKALAKYLQANNDMKKLEQLYKKAEKEYYSSPDDKSKQQRYESLRTQYHSQISDRNNAYLEYLKAMDDYNKCK